jgi:cytochrome oxidase Cu insertion factor (SCO1/SenC/PrrC family)
VDPFAAAFGVSIMRDDKPLQEILHNLRTPVIAPDGRLSEVLGGNQWTPEELLDAIRKADGRR